MQSYIRTSIILPKELADWIRKQAELEHRSVNNFIQIILLEKKREKEGLISCISRQ
jgi:hypothetical protein